MFAEGFTKSISVRLLAVSPTGQSIAGYCRALPVGKLWQVWLLRVGRKNARTFMGDALLTKLAAETRKRRITLDLPQERKRKEGVMLTLCLSVLQAVST